MQIEEFLEDMAMDELKNALGTSIAIEMTEAFSPDGFHL